MNNAIVLIKKLDRLVSQKKTTSVEVRNKLNTSEATFWRWRNNPNKITVENYIKLDKILSQLK